MPRVSRRLAAFAVGALLGVSVIAASGVAWYVSGEIWEGAFRVDHSDDPYNIEVMTFDEAARTLTLRGPGSRDLASAGTFGLEWEGGYGRLGAVVSNVAGAVIRVFELLVGEPPDGRARIDTYSLPVDPFTAHGIEFETVTYEAEGGPTPAWLVPGGRDTWVIAVHGRGGDRRESLRLLPTLVEFDLPVLVIAYRNDRELPLLDGARYGFGATEWRDVEAAVQYALDAGAEDVLLLGYSMGGGISTAFLYRSDLAAEVRAAILDSPAVRLASAADMQLEDAGVPGWLTRPMRAIAAWRYDIDWSESDHLSHAGALPDIPVLLLHGDADRVVPVETSRALAEQRPDIVTYVEFPGVGHARGWNQAREDYLAAVEAFLARVLAD